MVEAAAMPMTSGVSVTDVTYSPDAGGSNSTVHMAAMGAATDGVVQWPEPFYAPGSTNFAGEPTSGQRSHVTLSMSALVCAHECKRKTEKSKCRQLDRRRQV
jgi:hypothetical protein